MIYPPVNMAVIIGATVARMVISMIWLSPMLFWPAWSRYAGISMAKAKKNMWHGPVVYAIGSFLMAFVLAHAIFYSGARTLPLGLAVAFFNWLGFVAVRELTSVTDQKKPLGLFAVNAGMDLVSMLAMGAIIAKWGLRWV